MNLRFGGNSQIGTTRKSNQDSLFIGQNKTMCFSVVCDGVGGLENGEIASVETVFNLREWFINVAPQMMNFEEAYISLYNRVMETNNQILSKYNQNTVKTGTTVSAVLIYDNRFFIIHIGDSRIYKYAFDLTQITVDHTENSVRMIKGKESVKTVLSQCVGIKKEPNIYCAEGYVYRHEAFLLCTDGFYKRMEVHEIKKAIKKITRFTNIDKVCNKLALDVINRKEKDNLSIGIIKMC
ncbi:MAG: serine/threonine-protein phosphatase [Christensenella sp.]